MAGNRDLLEERNSPSFDVSKLSKFIYGQTGIERRQKIGKISNKTTIMKFEKLSFSLVI